MAGLSLYDPRKQVFRTYVPPTEADLPREELLLINILIELKAIGHYLQQAYPDSDKSIDIRNEIVSEI